MSLAHGWSRRAKIAWALAVAWAALVIWPLGADSFSMDQTASVFDRVLAWLQIELSFSDRYWLGYWLRKGAHAFEYGIFALLGARALCHWPRLAPFAACGAALLASLLLAGADEWRQSTTATRTGSRSDVALDFAGALTVLGLAFGAPEGLRRYLLPERREAR